MGVLTIILIALGLSIDSFVVSVANGISIKNLSLKGKLKIAFLFSGFHALMLLIGWYTGTKIEIYIKEFDHWIAFVLLVFIGIKMIYESFEKDKINKCNTLKISTVITQSVATSIDALAIGISFALFGIEIAFSVIVISIVTFIASIIGLEIGKYIGGKFSKYIEIIGGVILISIGLKILISGVLYHNWY